jgi:hypothetical protein
MPLAWMLKHYPDELEADFQRVYGIDLLDLYRGTLSPRKAMALAVNLPPGSAVWQADLHDNAWTPDQYVLADIADLTAGANWQRAGGKGTQPKPYPRPADARKKRDRDKALALKAARFKERQKASQSA